MLYPYYDRFLVEAGLDEAGRGCLAGPVVAAAVIIPKDYNDPELNDSKLLSKKQREMHAKEIKQEAIAWSVAEVSNTEIDVMNILNASFLAMHRALDKLNGKWDQKGRGLELLLVDGNRFKQYKNIPHSCIVKGDGKYMSIAAASILAKTYRDDLMAKLACDFPHYRWETNVGYPTKFHREAIKIYGVCEYHRKSFKLLY
ncbi:MAG: ribonuclease HII [Cytophagales bacterium]|nr:ribonuclease HII [Cytophagales bacterium]